MKRVLLGYEVGTGESVEITPTHLIVTGITQESGKTTTLQALIKRGGFKAVIFRTKIGEKGITEGTLIPPYFKERCLPPKTLVICNPELKSIEDLNVGDKVLDSEGEFTRITHTFQNEYDGDLIEVKPLGMPPVRMTPNHPILISERIHRKWRAFEGHYGIGESRWILADKLQKRCYLLVPRIKEQQIITLDFRGYIKSGKRGIKKTGIKIPLDLQIDNELAWLFGIYLAEGCSWVSKRKNMYCSSVVWNLGYHEMALAEKIKEMLERKFKLRAKIKERDRTIVVNIRSPILARFFKDNFGASARIKRIPSFVYKLPNEQIKGFIQGWLKGDGCIVRAKENHPFDRFSGLTTSTQIAYGLVTLGAKIGIPIYISLSRPPKTGFGKNPKSRWIVEILGDYAVDFGFPNPRERVRSRRAVKIDSNYLYYPVRKIERVPYSGLVYNIETETHTYGLPFVTHNSDWQFVSQLLEATLREKLKFERSWIIDVTKNNPSGSLLGVLKNVREKKAETKSSLTRSVLTTLEAYLEIVIPQLEYATFSKTLDLKDGINIMDLERFSEEIQSLVIGSVLEEILKKHRNTVVVIPECWKYLPEGRGNPIKRDAEAFIRQGATNNNYLFLDSQDITGVDKSPLKQISTWILGYQREINEIKRTLDQLPIPKKQKPTTDEIASLRVGHFYVATSQFTKKAYIIPSWLDEKTAREIALGRKDVSEVKPPESLTPFTISTPTPMQVQVGAVDLTSIKKDINELRIDFFKKIQDVTTHVNKISSDVFNLKTREQEIDIDEVVGKVLQKMPTSTTPMINKEEIINEVLARVPTVAGAVTYEVPPLEKIQKDFLEETKQKILSDVSTLDDEQKKILKFVETQSKGCNQTHIISKCLFLSATSGGTRQRISQKCRGMANLELIRMDKNSVVYPHLKSRIDELLGTHNASEQEREQVYNHILAEML